VPYTAQTILRLPIKWQINGCNEIFHSLKKAELSEDGRKGYVGLEVIPNSSHRQAALSAKLLAALMKSDCQHFADFRPLLMTLSTPGYVTSTSRFNFRDFSCFRRCHCRCSSSCCSTRRFSVQSATWRVILHSASCAATARSNVVAHPACNRSLSRTSLDSLSL
jgi:hypothetical protein